MLEKDPVPVGTGEVVKMEEDFSGTCDVKIPELEKLGQSGKLNEAIEGLTALEKQTRTVNLSSLYHFHFNI